MAKNQALHTLAEEDILWKDRKRILGLPLSFTTYEVDGSRLTTRQGLLSTTTDEMLLYRILDLQMKQTLGQKLCGVGTIVLYTADQSTKTAELKNVKHPDKVRRFISRIVEQQRAEKGITGREMVGAAGHDCGDCGDSHDGHAETFLDLDGDGIPD